jgi:hypothetical protein
MKNPYDTVRFRGHKFDARTRAAILALEARLGKRVTIYQGSYTGNVSVSSGTHLGGGAVDLWVDGMDADTVTRAARKVGWAMWWRTPQQGPWGHHQHGILREHRTASPAADAQVTGPNGFDYGGDGLADTTGDAQPWRPDPPVTFHYWQWVKARTLRSRLRDLSRSIASLKDRRRSVKKRLSKLS